MRLDETAERALRAAASDDPHTRHGRFAQFMQAVADLVETGATVLASSLGRPR
jgi:hypothetical protein